MQALAVENLKEEATFLRSAYERSGRETFREQAEALESKIMDRRLAAMPEPEPVPSENELALKIAMAYGRHPVEALDQARLVIRYLTSSDPAVEALGQEAYDKIRRRHVEFSVECKKNGL